MLKPISLKTDPHTDYTLTATDDDILNHSLSFVLELIVDVEVAPSSFAADI